MKNLLFRLLAICLIATTFQSCFKDKCEREITYIKYTPVYLTLDEMRGDVVYESPRALTNPGKIYYYDNHIYINELREGIHIIDNNDATNPVNVGFISIPGNVDISIKNNILFADNYTDLLSIDINDFTNPQILDREENAFPFFTQNEIDAYLVYYDEEEVTETIDCNGGGGSNRAFEDSVSPTTIDNNSTGSVGGQTAPAGIAGSLARFSIIGNYLYVVDEQDMYVYDINNSNNIQSTATINLGWGIETIFPYGDYIFIGSNTGMLIYDNTNPENPTHVADFEHAQACDPVFVKDDYAYVTLRGGTGCQNWDNQLDVINIADIENPTLESTVQMDHPHGLSIKDNNLIVCEGEFGFKTFDITDPLDIRNNMKTHNRTTTSYDVISLPGQSHIALIIGDDGFYQYDITNLVAPELISSILVER